MLYRNLFSCLSGNIVEWFEFAIYGYLASLMANLFFPAEDQMVPLLNTYVVFAIGFVMRPVGGAFFGYMGDKYGRKRALCWSILLMSIPTGCIGLLPTYHQIGFISTYALLVLRLLQGFSAGGELTSSFVFISEHAPKNKRGFYASFTMLTAFLGVWIGSFLGAIILNLSNVDAYKSWVWRVPFICAALVGLIGLYIRQKATETDVFKQQQENQATQLNMTGSDYLQVMNILLCTLSCAVSFYLLFVYLPTYLSQYTEVSAAKSSWINSLNLLLMICMVPIFGYISDLIGRRWVMLWGNLGLMVLAYPLFYGFLHLADGMMVLQFVLGIFVASIFAPMPAMISELVTKNRCRSVSMGFNLSIAFFGGTAPMLIIYVIQHTGIVLAPCFHIMFAAIISALMIYTNEESMMTTFKLGNLRESKI